MPQVKAHQMFILEAVIVLIIKDTESVSFWMESFGCLSEGLHQEVEAASFDARHSQGVFISCNTTPQLCWAEAHSTHLSREHLAMACSLNALMNFKIIRLIKCADD